MVHWIGGVVFCGCWLAVHNADDEVRSITRILAPWSNRRTFGWCVFNVGRNQTMNNTMRR